MWQRFDLANGGCTGVYSALLCALAAFCKPIFSLSIYWLNRYFDGIFLLRVGAMVDWLSFQFEYLVRVANPDISRPAYLDLDPGIEFRTWQDLRICSET